MDAVLGDLDVDDPMDEDEDNVMIITEPRAVQKQEKMKKDKKDKKRKPENGTSDANGEKHKKKKKDRSSA